MGKVLYIIGVCIEDKTDILSLIITPSHSCDVYGICKTTRTIGHTRIRRYVQQQKPVG